VAGCCECGSEPSIFGSTGLVDYLVQPTSNTVTTNMSKAVLPKYRLLQAILRSKQIHRGTSSS
jgi:hypothetical protein